MCLATINGKPCELKGTFNGYCLQHAQIYLLPELEKKTEELKSLADKSDVPDFKHIAELMEAHALQCNINNALFAVYDIEIKELKAEKRRAAEQKASKIRKKRDISASNNDVEMALGLEKIETYPFASELDVGVYFSRVFVASTTGILSPSERLIILKPQETKDFMVNALKVIMKRDDISENIKVKACEYFLSHFGHL